LQIFSKFGNIASCSFRLHFTGPLRGKPRGFCFVEMSSNKEAQACIEALNGRRLRGRELRVNVARDHEEISEIAANPDKARPANAPQQSKEYALEKRAEVELNLNVVKSILSI